MPRDKNGTVADVIMDPSSVPSRMNAGRLYEQWFCALSRQAKLLMTQHLAQHSGGVLREVVSYDDSVIMGAFDIVLGLLKIIDTEQYQSYLSVKDNLEVVTDLLQEVCDEELYLLYKVSSKKKPYQIVLEAENTIYKPLLDHIHVYNKVDDKWELSVDQIMIAPLYIILLAKTADNFLSAASAKTNHHGVPIGVGNTGRNRLPYRNSPVKTLSETETRLYLSYGGRLMIAELKDRANSPETHEHMYHNILTAPQPSNISRVVDRTKVPYGGDASLELVNNIFNAGGIEIYHTPDNSVIHPVKKG